MVVHAAGEIARNRQRSLIAILSSAFGVGLTIGMSQPLIALFLEGKGHSSLTIGIVAAVYSSAILIFGPFVPAVVSRLGTVRTLAFGTLVAAIAMALFPFAPALPIIILLRFIMGIGSACDWIVSETWVNTLPTEESRGRVVAIYATVWGAGTTGGPVILSFTGADGVLPFLVGAAILAVAFQPVLLARRIAPDLKQRSKARAIIVFIRSAPLPIAAGTVCGFAEGSVFSLFPVHATATGMAAERAVLLVSAFSLGNFALQAPIGWLADRSPRRGILQSLVIVSLCCLALIPFGFRVEALLWPTVVLFGAAIAGLYTLGMVILGQRYAGGDLAGASTAFILSYTVGMIIGPVVSGGAMAIFPDQGLLLAPTAVLIVFLLAISLIRPKTGIGAETPVRAAAGTAAGDAVER